jgi:hypothetical protein
MGRAIKWFIYQKDLLMVLALEDSIFLINVLQDIIRNQRRYNLERSSIEY